MKGIEEGSRQLVVACRDRAADFEMADHSFDAVALAIDGLVPADGSLAHAFGRDHRPNAVDLERGADCSGVVALVREELVGSPRLGAGHVTLV